MEQTNMPVDQLLDLFGKKEPTETQTQEFQNDGRSIDEILKGVSDTESSNEGEQDSSTNSTNPVEELTDADLKAVNLLIESGKLFPMEDPDGKLIPIKTKQDLLELFDSNTEYFQSQALQSVESSIYNTKSPVWRALLEYAEHARDISEVEPLFRVMSESQMMHDLNPEEMDDQEEIIRVYGMITGLDANTIDEDIKDLKERGKLEDRAKRVKPAIDDFNNRRTAQMIEEKRRQEQQEALMLQKYYSSVIENVIQPKEIGGMHLSDQHKQLIASALIPDPQIGGLPIYKIIDDTIAAGNFDLLSKVALLLTDPGSFDNYYNSRLEKNVASSLQKKLRTSSEKQTNNGSIAQDSQNRVQQNKQDIETGSKFYFGN